MMEIDIKHWPAGFVGRGLRKGAMASASTSVWEKAALPVLAGQFISTLCVPGTFRASFSPSLSLCRPFKRNAWTPEALCLTQPQSLLVYTLEPWTVGPSVGLGPEDPQRGLPQLKYPYRFLNSTRGCGTSPFCISPILPVSMLLLLYILGYGTSVQLDSWWFLMMVGL